MLICENIVKRYGDHTALNGVSIDVPEGKVFGLLGPNGAGKTTLIRIITRITGPDEGRVLFNGKPMTEEDVSQLGYLPEERGLYKKMKVGEQAVYLARLKGMTKAEATAKLKARFERWEMTDWWNKRIEELSKGMAQKVQFITTVMHEPKLLILDEPFSGFDPINADLVRNEIIRMSKEGTTILLSTHGMASVEELCDNIALIDRSKVMLHGNVKEVRKRYSTNTYSVEFIGSRIAFTNALAFHGELLDCKEDGQHCTARVKLLHGADLNAVLRNVLPAVTILGAQEEVPRMHDIFIRVVSEKEPSLVTSGMTE